MKKIAFKKIKSQIALLLVLVFALGLVQGCSKDSSETSSTPTTAVNDNATVEPTTAASAEPTYAPIDVRIGVNQSSYGWPFYVGRDAGIFAKYNINVTIDAYASGGETLDMVALKNEDVGEAADYALIMRLAAGSNLRAVTYFGESNSERSELYVNGEDIHEVKDLVGKKIGVKKGTVNEYTWAILFEKAGVDIDKVEQVNLSSDAELITAYAQGDIDALWSSGTNFEKLQSLVNDESKLRSIGNSRDLTGTTTKTYVVISDDFVQKNPEGAERFLKAYSEAVDYFKSNPDESADIISKAITIDTKTVKQDLTAFSWAVQFKQEDYDHLSNITVWAVKHQVIAEDVKLADFVNLDILKNIYPDRVDVNLN